MCTDMFNKVSEYVNGELAGETNASRAIIASKCHVPRAATSEEYDLLLRLNQITTAKYTDMAKLAGSLTDLAERLNDKCTSWMSLYSQNGSQFPLPQLCPYSSTATRLTRWRLV